MLGKFAILLNIARLENRRKAPNERFFARLENLLLANHNPIAFSENAIASGNRASKNARPAAAKTAKKAATPAKISVYLYVDVS